MNKLFSNKVFPKLSDNQIQNIEACYNELKGEVGNNFNAIVDNGSIIINAKYKESFDKFLYYFRTMYSEINIDEFKDALELQVEASEIMFWNIILEYCEQNENVKQQTKFIKDINQSEYEELIEYVFNKFIRYENVIGSYKKYDKEKMQVLFKFEKTIISCMLDDFYDLDRIFEEYEYKFGLNKERFEYIYNLINEHRVELMLKNITEYLQDVTKIDS